MDKQLAEKLMRLALQQAELAAQRGEVPVGAVIARDFEIIAVAHNLVETEKDASRHAEMIVLQEASKKLGDWRLKDLTLCVTLEPCSMCIGAAKLARVDSIIFGAEDPEKGACGSLFDLSQDARVGPNPRLITGILANESISLLRSFFRQKRK